MFRDEDGFNMSKGLLTEKEMQSHMKSLAEESARMEKEMEVRKAQKDRAFEQKISQSTKFMDWAKTVSSGTVLKSSFEDCTVKQFIQELGLDVNQYWYRDGEVFNRTNSYTVEGSEREKRFLEEDLKKIEHMRNAQEQAKRENQLLAEGERRIFFESLKVGDSKRMKVFGTVAKAFVSVNDDLSVAINGNKVVTWNEVNGFVTVAELQGDTIITNGKAGLFIGKAGCVIKKLSSLAGRRLEVK